MIHKNMTLLMMFLLMGLFTYGQDVIFASGVTETEHSVSSGATIIEYNVLSLKDRLNEISPETAGTHLFGAQVAKELYLFDNTFTYKVPVSPGNPTVKTIVQKPVIYSAVRKIERQLKKEIRSKKIDTETASAKYSKVLEIAISTFNMNTEQLEERIKSSNDNSNLLRIFTEEIKLNYIY